MPSIKGVNRGDVEKLGGRVAFVALATCAELVFRPLL